MAVVVEGLVKRFDGRPVVDDLGFRVDDHALFAFLGTNGAGKSTTIRCVTTVLAPDSGRIVVNGRTVGTADDLIRRDIGVVFQGSVLDDLLTVRQNLTTRARFYGLSGAELDGRLRELALLIGLDDLLDRRYGTLSGGQRRRADIARALVHRPSVVFLDEPTTGLDPQSREQVWDTIHRLRQERGTTVFLTTHYLEETEAADSVCIIDAGRIVAEGTPEGLRQRYSSSLLTIQPRDVPGALRLLHDAGLTATALRERIRIEVSGSDQARLILGREDLEVLDFEFRHGTMDDVFLALTDRRLRA